MSDFTAGQTITVAYPFVRDRYVKIDEHGYNETPTWKPGCRYEETYNRYGEPDYDVVADGMGSQILTIIDIHKPGKYPERVFFTIAWISPDGKKFGKSKLRIMTTEAFKRRASGFMSHDLFFKYRISGANEEAA